MHELSIAEALLESAAQFLPEGAAAETVCLDVGSHEHIEQSALRTAFEALAEGTPFGQAKLEITLIELELACGACSAHYFPEDVANYVCTECGAVRPKVIAGSGVILKSIEAHV